MSEVIKNRYEIAFFVEAKMCNPNGDPDMGNHPRQDFETENGYITDVAIKSRIRAYIEDAFEGIEGMEILVRNGVVLNQRIDEAANEVSGDEPAKKETNNSSKRVLDARDYMCKRYFDVRTFGGVLSTGLNAGQVRGAVQVAFATSLDPIEIYDNTITRKVATGEKDLSVGEEQKDKTMGKKTFIPYGLYFVKMTISANLAKKVCFTEDDLSALLEAICQMYDADASSSKMGMSVIAPIVVFKHIGTQNGNPEQNAREAMLGCAPAYKLFELIEVQKKDGVDVPRDYKDYDAVLNLSRLPDGVDCLLKDAAFSSLKDAGKETKNLWN